VAAPAAPRRSVGGHAPPCIPIEPSWIPIPCPHWAVALHGPSAGPLRVEVAIDRDAGRGPNVTACNGSVGPGGIAAGPPAEQEREGAVIGAAIRTAAAETTLSSKSMKKLLTLLHSTSTSRDSTPARTRKSDGTIEMVIAHLQRCPLDPHTSRRAAEIAGGGKCMQCWCGAAAQRDAPCAMNRGDRAPCDSTSHRPDADDSNEHTQQDRQGRQGGPERSEAQSPGRSRARHHLTTVLPRSRLVDHAPIERVPQAITT
jgi:hypothetical protein